MDSAFAKPSQFKKLRKKANLAHVRHTFKLSGQTEDDQIYNLATKEDRIIVTQDNDFKKHIKPNKAVTLIIPSYLSNDEIDRLLTDFVNNKDPKDYKGKATKI